MDATITTPDPTPPAPVGSAARLAAALGLNKRTIYKLRQRGAPEGHDEAAWREWCRREGIRLRPSLTEGLLEVPRSTAPDASQAPIPGAPPTTPAAPSKSTVPEVPTTWSQEKSRRDADLKAVQQQLAQRELDQLDRVLIHRDEVGAAMRALAVLLIGELVDLPVRVVQALPDLPADVRPRLRRAAEQEIEALRGRVSADLRKRLLVLMTPVDQLGGVRRPAADDRDLHRADLIL